MTRDEDRPAWGDLFRDLGQSLLTVIRAEIAALGEELSDSARQAGMGAGFFAAAGALAFWTLGVGTYALVQLAALWLPLVGAAFLVTGLFAAGTGLVAYLGVRRLRKVNNPGGLLRQRLEDHTAWWQGSLLSVPADEARDALEASYGDEADDGEDPAGREPEGRAPGDEE
jgi:membrane protein implicated in regulation of membrane protease activity